MSLEVQVARRTGARLGPGALVLVVGASGVGKDALISGARTLLAEDERFAFPERVITRPPNDAENHVSLSDAEFAEAVQEGRFALAWEAHGLRYGVPVGIDSMIARGRTVIVNASRAIGNTARQHYARVSLVLVECPAGIRAARIVGRGRETPAEVEARLARQVTTFDPAEADAVIDNSGSLADGVSALVDILRSLPEAA